MVVTSNLHIRGCAIDVSQLKRNLSLSNYTKRIYRITLREEEKVEGTVEPAPPKEKVKKPKRKMISAKVQAREKRLQEILTSTNQVKKRRVVVVEKLPLPVANNVYPTYKILAELYKSQKKTLEEMKLTLVVPFNYDRAQDSMFDMAILLPYMSEAYHSLYEQHVDRLKDIIKSKESSLDEQKIKRKILDIKGIMDSEESNQSD